MVTILWLWGCTTPGGLPDADDRAGLVRALHALPDADAAMAECRKLGPAVRGDCTIAAVEAAPRSAHARAWCASLGGADRDECFFQLAEKTDDLAACADAGSFVDDCRLHVWSRTLRTTWPTGTSMADGVARSKDAMKAVGIDPTDARYWSATFRHALLADPPFDRGRCEQAGDAMLVDVCRRTAVVVWNDLLNHERDFGHFPCDGGELPKSLQHAPDPDLDQILDERRAADLCR